MKAKIQIKRTLVFALFTVLVSFKGNAQDKIYENRYLFLYVPAVFQDNKTAYFSDLIFYSNYNQCGGELNLKTLSKRAFSNYLSSNYNSVFPYGTQEIVVVEYKELSTSQYLKSKQEAYDTMNALKAKILSNNHSYSGHQDKVVMTNFSYTCE